MRKIQLSLVLLMLININIFPQEGSDDEKPQEEISSLKALIGFTWQPYAFWRSGQFVRHGTDNSYSYFSDSGGLAYDLDNNSFTVYEGELWHKKGFNIGISIDLDNNFVGKLYNFMGRIGYKNAAIRVSGGDITGSARWGGALVSGQAPEVNIETKYLSVDLLIPMWWIKDNESEGIYNLGRYFGLSYTRYEMPLEFQALTKGHWAYPAYDDKILFHTYGFIFGFDNLNWSILTRREGFSLWLYTQDTFFGGSLHLSDEGARRLSAANSNGNIAATNFFLFGVQYDLTVGIGWVKKINQSALGIGLGYTISGRGMLTFGGKGLSELRDTEITPQSFPYLFRHGIVLKAAYSR